MNDIGGLESPDTGPQGYGPGSGVVQPSLWESADPDTSSKVRLTVLTATELHTKKSRILAERPYLATYRVDWGQCESSVEDEVREDFGADAAYAWCELREIEWLLGED